MVQWQMYCPEQIIVPQKFPNILKTYAKAVIRTQPYDLLRWSAAYFRCLALNLPPPVKVRLEKESRFGKLTKGYLRVLVEQLGKGFFVQRDVLQRSWATLSLPEEDLLKFLSLCRMLHWSQVHWLELFAVMVGSLNDNFHSTVQMLFELLTDDPEGGPSPIPSWMFNVCYSFVAKLDCSKPQSFVNGRKVLGDNKLEDANKEPDPPKMYSLDLFRYALIERFIQNEQYRMFEQVNEAESQTSFFSNHSDVTTSFNFVGLEEREDVANEAKDFKSVLVLLNEAQREALTKFNNRETKDKIIQHLLMEKKIKKNVDDKSNKDNVSITSMEGTIPSTVRSDISSSFKFIGNLRNPYEAIKKTPDIDSVLMSLSKAQRNTLRNVTKRETGDERVKEELFRDLPMANDSTARTGNASDIEISLNHKDLTKGLEYPWAWIQQFSTVPQCNEKSYNFVESDATPADGTPNLLTDGSFDYSTGNFKGDVSDVDESTLASARSDDTDGKLRVIDALVAEIVDRVDAAINEGKCDIKNIKNICSVLSEQSFVGREDEIKIINDTLQKADEAQFGNCDELTQFLKSECTNELMQKVSIEPLSKKLMECDIPFDENIATKKVPENMILGLVEPTADSSETVTSDKEIENNPPTTMSNPSDVERKENIRIVDGFITDAIDEIQFSDTETDDTAPEENVLPPFNCDMPALPGIGKACSPKVMDAFLVYILSQARDEKGMVYPRFLKEPNCPVMIDSLN